MKRRILAAVAALVLAVAGAAALFSYVSHADQRAMEGQRAVSVLVVGDKPVPKGTSADQLSQYVTAKSLPAVAVAPTAVAQVDQLNGLVTDTDLEPGDQVLKSRFVDPAALAPRDHAPIPKGMQELTLQLDQQRVVGGTLKAGDKVGVFVTVGNQPKQTHLVLNGVLVTRIIGAPATDGGSSADNKAAAGQNGSVTVALALSGPDAEKVVFGQEDGTVWLSLQTSDTTDGGTSVVTEGNVFK
jgi:pilus assembly protein CpaB